MKMPEGWPTREMILAGNVSPNRNVVAIFEAMLSVAPALPVCNCDLRTKLVGDGCEICNPELAAEMGCPPTPQEVERRAWMIPSIMRTPGNAEIDGTVAWEASVFCDSQNIPRIDKRGVTHYPYPIGCAHPPAPKASWDADGNPTNLEAAAEDAANEMGKFPFTNAASLYPVFNNLRKFLPEGE